MTERSAWRWTRVVATMIPAIVLSCGSPGSCDTVSYTFVIADKAGQPVDADSLVLEERGDNGRKQGASCVAKTNDMCTKWQAGLFRSQASEVTVDVSFEVDGKQHSCVLQVRVADVSGCPEAVVDNPCIPIGV